MKHTQKRKEEKKKEWREIIRRNDSKREAPKIGGVRKSGAAVTATADWPPPLESRPAIGWSLW